MYNLADREKQPGEPLYHALDFSNNLGEQPLQFIMVANGERNITKLEMELNNFSHIEIPVSLKDGNVLVYEKGDQAALYDKHWNEIKKISVDGTKLSIPMASQQMRLEFEGSPGAAVKA